jgi:HK97 gp10 family phage protein
MSMKVTIKGLPELKGKLAKLSAEMRGDASRRATLAGAQVFESGIKMNIQRQGLIDTGFMLNSVTAQNTSGTEADVGPAAEYAIYHEYGTSRMPARPYMRPAFDEGKGDALNAAVEVLKDAVKV